MDLAKASFSTLIISTDQQCSNSESVPSKVCPICNKQLPPNANLSFHMMLHPSEKHFACDFCLHVFKTKEDLKKHCYDDHVSESTHICEVCGKVFRFQGNLKRHQSLRHKNEYKYMCIYCDTPFKEYGQYRAHEASHDRVTDFQCEVCNINFLTSSALDSHSKAGKCAKKVLKCCDMEFNTRMEYVQHTLVRHKKYKQIAHKCRFCHKTFAFTCIRNVHERRCHIKTAQEDPKEKQEKDAYGNTIQIPCEYCKRLFNTYRGMLKHAIVHKSVPQEKKYTCTICNKTLASNKSLYIHRAQHMNIKRFFCDFCQKGFFQRSMMIAHRAVHTNEKPFKCRYCEKGFPYKASMLAHERSHTGERPFPCKYCDMRFMRVSAQQNHERRHTGEKPYTCKVCDKSFVQYSTWKQHERTHSDRIACEFCGNEFSTKKQFKLHRRGGQCDVSSKEPDKATVKEVNPGNQPSHKSTDADGNVYEYYQLP